MICRVHDVLSEYLLLRDLRPDTERFYRRTVSVFDGWSCGREMTPSSVSEFLRDKQRGGASPYYLRSLRSGLRALLNFEGHAEKIRSVKLPPLDNATWQPSDVPRLIAAVPLALSRRVDYWQTIIPAAWYTGLSQCDLWRLDRSHVDAAGVVRMRRSKTGRLAVCRPPATILDVLRSSESPPWRLQTSPEYFRREFALIVRAAGLAGTFKTIRKSAGTDAERLHPGRGHELLANSRRVFEWHYLDSRLEVEPIGPRLLDSPPLPPQL
jgi:integrase